MSESFAAFIETIKSFGETMGITSLADLFAKFDFAALYKTLIQVIEAIQKLLK